MSKNSPSLPSIPTKGKFAKIFRILGRISFWIQLALGASAAGTLLLVNLSRSFNEKARIPFLGLGILFAVAAILALGFRIYWAWRYVRLARSLRQDELDLQPTRQEIIRVLRLGLVVSLIALILAFVATNLTVVGVLAKALAQPQGVAVYNPENIVRSLDIFLILADVNLLGAHIMGLINSLALLNWLTK